MRAADVMNPTVISVRPEATVSDAVRLMLQDNISGLPVVDAMGSLVGIVTEGDFLRRAEIGTERKRPRWLEFVLGPGPMAADYVHAHTRKVSDIMTRDVATVTEETPLEDIVKLMETRRIKRVPVMRGHKIKGIVSRANLLHALAAVSVEDKPASKTDTAIRERVMAELNAQFWNPRRGANIVVRNGIVDIYGVVFDARERDALRVAAENVPGVTKVRDHMVWIEPFTGTVVYDGSGNGAEGADSAA